MFRADSLDSSLCQGDHDSQQDVGDSDQDSQQDVGDSDQDSQQDVDESDHDDKQEAENNDHNETTSSEKLRNLLQDPSKKNHFITTKLSKNKCANRTKSLTRILKWIS